MKTLKGHSGTILHKFSVCYTIYSSLNFSKILFLQGKRENSLGSALHAGAILQLGFKSIAKNTKREKECKLRETILFFNAAIYAFIIVKMITNDNLRQDVCQTILYSNIIKSEKTPASRAQIWTVKKMHAYIICIN